MALNTPKENFKNTLKLKKKKKLKKVPLSLYLDENC